MNELFRWEWVVDHLDDVAARSWEHVFLTVVAVGIGFLISFPLGVYSHRHRRV